MTQQQRLLKFLEVHRSITPLFALRELGIYRLSDTVYKLRNQGYDIRTYREPVSTRYGTARVARYVLQ